MEISHQQTKALEICFTPMLDLLVLEVREHASQFDPATDKIYRASAKTYYYKV